MILKFWPRWPQKWPQKLSSLRGCPVLFYLKIYFWNHWLSLIKMSWRSSYSEKFHFSNLLAARRLDVENPLKKYLKFRKIIWFIYLRIYDKCMIINYFLKKNIPLTTPGNITIKKKNCTSHQLQLAGTQ